MINTKVISEYGDRAISFEKAAWSIVEAYEYGIPEYRIIARSENTNYVFARYDTMQEAREKFETFINHVGNENEFNFKYYVKQK